MSEKSPKYSADAIKAVKSEMRRKTPKAPLYMWPYFTVRFLFLFSTLMFLIACTFVLFIIFCWFPRNHLFEKMKNWASGCIFAFEVWLVEKFAGISMEYYGDKIPANEGAICISNHVMGTDYLTFFPLGMCITFWKKQLFTDFKLYFDYVKLTARVWLAKYASLQRN